MTSWSGEFVLIEAKGLKERGKKVSPEKSAVRKEIEKPVTVEKLPASVAEKLLRRTLVEKQFELTFRDIDVRLIYIIQTALFGSSFSNTDFQDAAVRARLHLDNTLSSLSSSSPPGDAIYNALRPFGGGELTDRDKAVAKIYMWFLYGKNRAAAKALFESILKRDRVSVDLADFVGAESRMFNGKTLLETLRTFPGWAGDVFYHSFDSVKSVLTRAEPSDLQELVRVAFELDASSLNFDESVKSFLIYLHVNRRASSFDAATVQAVYEKQNIIAPKIFPIVDVQIVRLMYRVYDVTKYWIALVKTLVAAERISSDNLIYLVSELQGRRALSDADEADLTDAAALLELTRSLEQTELGEGRQGFTFRA